MALPPWLQINPRDYLAAVESGTRAGLSIRQASEQAWESAQRMQMEQQAQQQRQQQLGVENQQNRLAQEQLDRYRQQQAATAAQRATISDANEKAMQKFREAEVTETGRHNLATEQEKTGELARGASLVNHPELPGYTFLRNPSGAESVVSRPARPMTDEGRMGLQLRASNAMKLGSEDPTDPAYQSRTNLAGGILRSLSPDPSAPPAPSDAKQRKAGTTYKTPKGNFTWTGKGWSKPQTETGSIPMSPVTSQPDDGE